MNKTVILFLAVVVCLILLVCCAGKEDNINMDSIPYTTDDSKELDLAKAYDINELKSFFEGSNANENLGFDHSSSSLTFSEVNQRFPVEINRAGGYSVYRVVQGGYFYVFWSQPLDADTGRDHFDPSVYFSAYLCSAEPPCFDSIIVGSSTAEDVRQLDPAFELSFLMSSGIFSYSFLDEERILEIEYERRDKIGGYDDLVVKGMSVIPRSTAPSGYRLILTEDLP